MTVLGQAAGQGMVRAAAEDVGSLTILDRSRCDAGGPANK